MSVEDKVLSEKMKRIKLCLCHHYSRIKKILPILPMNKE
jgi:hypothetical protein